MIAFLRPLAKLRSLPPAPAPAVVKINGRDVHIRFRRNARARRMVLRLDPKTDGFVMTLPARTSTSEAMQFAAKSWDWIAKTLGKHAPKAALADGASMLYLGSVHVLRFGGGRRGLVSAENAVITVPGDAAHAPRRLQDFMKKQALVRLSAASQSYASAMNAKFTRISIRDQKSRWGSCSSKGVLSYSWRLILAPEMVLDYVAAHEVAHLREMNHGPRFWRLVLTHCPHAKAAKQWLKKHGKDVHRYF